MCRIVRYVCNSSINKALISLCLSQQRRTARTPYENESGLHMGSLRATTETVGSSFDRSCPIFMLIHYNISHGLHLGSLVGRSYPLTFKLIMISDHGLPMGSSNCYITHSGQLSGQAPTLTLRK